jgi:hypothetical protein
VADEESSDREELIFDPVWLVLERPRPNFNAARFFAPGKLVIRGQRAIFGPSDARLVSAPSPQVHLSCDHVVGVRRERYGRGLVPRFVGIEYQKPEGDTQMAYFNDAEWNGWRPLLTRSNRRMAEAIARYLRIE